MSKASDDDIDVSPVPNGTCAVCRKPVAPRAALDEEADIHAECINALIADLSPPTGHDWRDDWPAADPPAPRSAP